MHVRSDIDEPPAKRCKFCDEPARDAEQHTLWFLTLDLDLVNWIKERYPNWFNNKNTIQPVHAAVSTTTPTPAAVARRLRTPPLLASLPLLTIPAKLSPIKAEINTINCTSSIYSGVVIDKKMAEGEQPAAPSNITDSPLMGSVDEYNKIRQSPPKVVVDTTPLQPQMDKNKESLKVKLMLRRTADQLADIGIYPTLTTSPALHEQRKQLERAKTGDLLKAKIQQRPDRRELERRHILEHEESFVDPSLAEKQRMLKKARLADQLSSQITHRPGPLELIKKNILHTEEPIERIVKQGLVAFKSTSEALLNRPQHPHSYTVFEDDSQSSEGDLSCSPVRPDVLEAAAASAGIVTVTIPTSGGPVVVTSAPVLTTKFHPTLISTTHVPPPPPPPPPLINSIKTESFSLKNSEATSTPTLFAELCQSVAGTITGNTSSLLNLASSPSSLVSTLSPLSSVPSPPGSHTPRPIPSPLQQNNHKTDAPGKDKNRKKSKTKPITKERTIKFHEYKGPPNSQKNSNSLSNSKKVEEWYQICLNQQNCLVDLEGISSKQKAILPAPMKSSLSSASLNQNDVIMSQPSPAPSNTSSIPPSPAPSYTQENNININLINNNSNINNNNNNNSSNGNSNNNNSNLLIELNKLEKMKVSDLKLQLKKRNLPVSGPKPQLIERLKPFLPLDSNNNNNNNNNSNFISSSNNINNNGDTSDIDLNYNSPKNSLSPESEHENGNNNNCIGTITLNGGNMMDIQQDSPMSFSLAGRQTPLVSNDEIVREQQRQIDELQRQLKEKQEELLQMKTQQNNITIVDKQHQDSINQKLKVKQCLEAKIFKEKLQQIENLNRKNLLLNGALNNTINNNINNNMNNINGNSNNNNNNNNINNNIISSNPIFITSIKEEPITIKSENNNSTGNLELLWHENPTTLVLVDLNNENKKLINGHHRTSSMPSILVPITTDLDLKPPPPQYEEATQKLKIEHNTNSNSSNASSNNGGPVVKSQELSDVLDILITNGELPESVLTSTPTTPSTHPNMDENNINLNLFDNSSLQHHNLHHPGDENSFTSLILDTHHSDVLNDLDCMSPMQSDHHNDIDETAKTLDMLLGQTTTSNSNLNNHSNSSNHSQSSLNNNNSSNSDRLIKFSELDFNNWPAYELMKQQLEMEMGDDCNNHYNNNNNSTNNSNSINNNNNNNNNNSNNNNKKRDMNPSLQPSLNELISSSSNSNHDYITFSHNGNINNNNNCDAMDVDFVNSLSSFDFRTIISPTRNGGSVGNLIGCNTGNTHHHSHTIDTPPHPFQSIHNMNHHHHNGGNLHMHQNGLIDAGSLNHHHHQNGNNIVSGPESIFDLNLDDLNVGAGDQMSWEVDFTLMNCH